MKIIKNIIPIILLIIISSCSNSEPKNKLTIPKKGFEFQIYQRESFKIPSTKGNIICHIDDITQSQVYLSISENENIFFQKSIHEGEDYLFKFETESYKIECIQLINILIGNDYGIFKISTNSVKSKPEKISNETEKIEKLIQTVRESGITFIRNGAEYTSIEAADHITMKWENAKSEIKTVDQFIQNIASKSSSTGNVYQIKLKDGTIINAEDWLKKQL